MFTYLLIDDEVLIRKGTIKKIQRAKLPITCIYEANNGEEAISYLQDNKVDFIITDMDMPKLDGVQLLKYLENKLLDIPVIVISGYQNFTYLQQALKFQAIDYILKPFGKEEITESIQKVISILEEKKKDQVMNSELLFGVITGNSSTRGSELLNKYLLDYHSIYLILVYQKKNNSFEQEIFLKDSIININHPKSGDITFYFYEEKNMSILDEFDFVDSYYVKEKFNKNKESQITYNSLIDTMNGLCSNLTGGEISFSDTQDYPIFSVNTNYLLFLIESGSSKELDKDLNLLFNNIIDNGYSLKVLKEVGFTIIEATKEMLNQFYKLSSNYTLPNLKEEIHFEKFDMIEIKQLFIQFLTNISEAMKYEDIYSSDDLIINVKRYIQLHYSEDINLNFLGEIFYVNSSYLSSLFKEKTGKKYIDFLNELRIEEAKKQLVSTTKNIKQISHQVGYDNEKYFYRVFKKFTDSTPEQYRNINKFTPSN